MSVGNPNHDPKTGQFSSGSGGARNRFGQVADSAAERTRAAVDYVRSPEGQRVIAKSAVTYALQNALFHMSGVENAIADAYIEHQVSALAHHLSVARGTARSVLIATIDRLIEKRRASGE